MTPNDFWVRLLNQFRYFMAGITPIMSDVIHTMIDNPLLVLVFGYLILGIVISIFRRIIDG